MMLNQTAINQAVINPSEQFNTLVDINIHDLLVSFGLENLQKGRGALEAVFKPLAQHFARQMVAFDRMVGEVGLYPASIETLKNYIRRLEVEGQENIPPSGPVLVLSNHPGMTDTLVLFSSLPCADLRIVAAERPFLQSLTNISRRIIYVSDESSKRMSVVRTATNHLRQGGAILTFPAGVIEPDPATMPGAVASLEKWSESIAVFARLVPDVQLITAIVSGVIWPKTMNHPLTRLRRQPKDRELLGATLQAMVQATLPFFQPVPTRVIYSKPILASNLLAKGDSSLILEAITAQARQLIERSRSATRQT